jgi:hypothetical protein
MLDYFGLCLDTAVVRLFALDGRRDAGTLRIPVGANIAVRSPSLRRGGVRESRRSVRRDPGDVDGSCGDAPPTHTDTPHDSHRRNPAKLVFESELLVGLPFQQQPQIRGPNLVVGVQPQLP